ncbi:DEAD/DEAH box helicase family protein [Anaerobutyricum hallii]|uniref:DEAD/DEAH box helicase family protein n=1 Tax=Anaerobutyricum hallii TaxID=39488 RepID=UPI00266C7C5D|nr:DEAD/DEAH box helicase family protein [Anaerobutyricum hallii]
MFFYPHIKCHSHVPPLLFFIKSHNPNHFNKQSFISVDESVAQVSSELNAALKKNTTNIHLIPGQTGIGKTTIYVKLIKSRPRKKPFLIAVPTNNLKSELVQKIGRDKVLEIPSFEDLPLPPELRQTIEKNYSMGFINDALESIKTYAHNSKDNSIFMNYLHPETALAHSSKCVIMTHARFLTLPNRVLKNFEVLIDEDILYTMLTRTGSVQISSLKKALKANVFSPEKQIEIEELLKLKDNKCCRNRNRYSLKLDMGTLKNCKTTDNLIDFAKADCYMKQKDCIKYLAPVQLPKCKMIILSATLDETIYNLFFPERKIVYHEIEQAAYKGNLIQYPCYSMSRKTINDFIEKNTLHCPTVSALFKKIITNTDNVYYGITFKKYENDIPLEHTLHFGNLTGTDYYSGKNGVIIGTPHFPSYLYQLIAFSIGISEHGSLKNRKVSYKGYQFLMMACSSLFVTFTTLY